MLSRTSQSEKAGAMMRRMRVIRFITTGGIGISVNLGLYYLLVHFIGAHYLAGSIIAVTCSTIVGFLLQKFWTFEEKTTDTAHVQFMFYSLVAILNIGLNTLIVYILAGVLTMHYLLAQGAAGGIVAVWSYFIYRELIFKRLPGSNL